MLVTITSFDFGVFMPFFVEIVGNLNNFWCLFGRLAILVHFPCHFPEVKTTENCGFTLFC